MWQDHWKLDVDPFSSRFGVFIPLPSRVEALARLAHIVESGHRVVSLIAESGQGKSILVREALNQARQPDRRLVYLAQPLDAEDLTIRVARGLGRRVALGDLPWRELLVALDLASLQGQHIVVAVDESEGTVTERLEALSSRYHLTVIRVSQSLLEDAPTWGLTIPLPSLTRRESATYLETRWRWAGGKALPLDHKGLTTLHSLANGVPGELNRLASLGFERAARDGYTFVTEGSIEALAAESVMPGWSIPRRIG